MKKINEKTWKMPKITHRKCTKYIWLCVFPEKLKMGKYTDIGGYSLLNARYGIEIGENVQIGPHCDLVTNDTIGGNTGKIVLEKDCKIGAHSTIMPNVTIGENSIIGAYSLVKKTIPKNVLAYGVPAKVIRKLKKEEISNGH